MGQILKGEINSIFQGKQPAASFGEKGQYRDAIAIDPDVPATDGATDLKTAGIIRPVNYSSFSGANVTSHPIAIITNPKNTNTYTVLANGRLISYNSALGSETLIGTVTGDLATGAFYYNNYIYIMTGTDVSRYGPLDGTPALTNTVWTGATLGTQTTLINTTYPTTRLSVSYLNHHGIVHVDNKAYFLDFNAGQGKIHFIKTSKTTNEGDTNNGSTYNVFSGGGGMPFNYLPTTISSFGNDIVVAGTLVSSGSVLQGESVLLFYNPADTTPSFYRPVFLSDAICTVLAYKNGRLYGISGDLDGSGYRLWQYVGGDTVQTLKIIEDDYPPMQNAWSSVGNRLIWASSPTNPLVCSGLMAYGSKSDLFPRGLHNIALSAFTS